LLADHARFYTPGHKGGQSLPVPFLEELGQWDLPELAGWSEAIAEAEALASDTFGAQRSWFLVNGSTIGIQAMLLAVCQAGEQVLIGRNCHRSVIAGLILSGAEPIYLPTDYDPQWQIELGVSPAVLAQFVEVYPQAKAVLITSPNYFGVCADLPALAAIAHQRHMPLLVDAAHGTHLGFHPHLPSSALQAGADVVVQSAHKTASALSQASLLHWQGQLVDPDRLNSAVNLLQTTSANFLLLLSLDCARWQLATQGRELLERTLQYSHELPKHSPLPVFPSHDPTRFTVSVRELGITGFAGDRWLSETCGVICELPTLHHLVFSLSIGTSDQDITKLLTGLNRLKTEFASSLPLATLPSPPTPTVRPSVSPRSAFTRPSKTVGVECAIGMISAETLCPYPPGVPVVALGEVITPEAIAYLQAVYQAGGVITGASDPSFSTMKVLI